MGSLYGFIARLPQISVCSMFNTNVGKMDKRESVFIEI